ncbi:MAG: Ribonucleoside-diphosphate reductase, adenosylcobalamin-dependent [Parcubacteria group bacterium GW2011_GWA1_59_11]|nr:MAG: Ribonucleoside-diphosphate reductase, adenosylcobalamin-dependent [Parcubacteria group bacterium GW2011_GWA1_59_11]
MSNQSVLRTSSQSNNAATEEKSRATLPLKRYFTKEGTHPFDEINWVKRDAVVGSGDRKVFEQRDVEFPDFWSPNAVNITVSKYFRGKLGSPERETSAKQMINRVAKTIRGWGEKFGYFHDQGQAETFEDELTHLLVYQKGSFNSPVWFNVGTKATPQCSACFILAVEDDMNSILDWIKTEGKIFKGGSGSGVNLSNLRSRREHLSGGGYASGPVSFMRGADSVAGMIKSGGTTRRAAKMVVLNIDHPDVMDFINCKVEEEKKVRALMAAGYDMSDLNNDAWGSIQFQNANNTVRITDEFMHAVEMNSAWETRYRVSGETAERMDARQALLNIAKAAWECGDPGVQFDTIINDWHTCPASGRINASNPCSEYMHLDNSACNLASLNLMKFLREDGSFMVQEFRRAVDVFILAQDIIVSGSSYPTEEIGKNAKAFRELGLGFANLGALLMTKGLPYDSDGARAWAGTISSLMTGEAYRYSAEIARCMKPFDGYAPNREAMLRVIGKHRDASRKVDFDLVEDKKAAEEAQAVWDRALSLGGEHGYRNSQVTVIAPTGTISFMMDCDTTGVEPDFSLVKMKQLVGGGWMKLVNAGVSEALRRLGYSEEERTRIVDWIAEHSTVEGSPDIKAEHLAVFDCAVRSGEGTRSISWQGHVRLVAAVQPFVSGAISKTFNMPSETTAEEIFDAYLMAWKLGIKAFAIYRDGSKATQPLYTGKKKNEEKKEEEFAEAHAPAAFRRRLPTTRVSETHRFSVAGHKGYLTYSTHEDGSLAEIFIRIAKQGSTLSGLLDAFAIAVSVGLQYGVPLKDLANKFIYSRFEPAGFTENPDIRIATSIVDYIFRYLSLRFLPQEELEELGLDHVNGNGNGSKVDMSEMNGDPSPAEEPKALENGNGNGQSKVSDTVCRKCGGMMVRTGTCLTCLYCGSSSGGCS